MKHKTLEQAASEALLKFMNTGTPDTDDYWSLFKVKDEVNDALVRAVEYGYKKGHIAGASWREQQAASGFEEWARVNDRYYPKEDYDLETMKIAWQASALHSTKLLAEKDAEIKTLKEKLKAERNDVLYMDKIFHEAKELIKEMLLAMDWQGHSFQSTRFFVEFNCKNAEKIKALLGEE